MKKVIYIFKLILAYIYLNVFNRNLYKKNVWLVSEKKTEARDNGYHFFKYLREKHPDLNVFYIISKDSVDLHKISKYGNTITVNSFKHFIYALAAKYSISSQLDGSAPYPKRVFYKFKKLCRKDQCVVYLKHGIIALKVSNAYTYDNKLALFCTASSREKNFIQERFKYPKNVVQVTGLCRFDNLMNSSDNLKKQILIMPTFRPWLVLNDSTKHASKEKEQEFLNSEFYKTYCELINNNEFITSIKEHGYKIVFYPHYSLQSYIKCFEDLSNDCVIIADRKKYDVQQLLMESSIMITDYSSVFFDFAYMNKPMLFFQFDNNRLQSFYNDGSYFNCERDGFGPVVTNVNDLVREIIKILQNGAQPEEKYIKRINDFFDVRDNNNCKRVYEAIKNIMI